jgi:nitric oxide synthase-interacting protein
MGHNLKLKQLIKVDFTLTKGASIDSPNTIGLYSCHPCQKTLNSVPAVVLFKPCGHVVCKACSDKFVTRKKGASSASTSSAADMKECCVCTAKLPLETDIVVLQASGSGYAGGAGEEKLAKVTTPAPRFA